MTKDYDTNFFIQIIESVQGVRLLRTDNKEDVHICFYTGVNGRLVIIDTSDEEIPDDTAKSYLSQLGLDYLIPSLFPIKEISNDLEEQKVVGE